MFTPVKTLNTISKNNLWLAGIILFSVVMIFNMIVNRGIVLLEPVEQVLAIPNSLIWLVAFIGVIFSVIMLFIMSGLYSLLGEIIYQTGNAKGLLASLGFASLPGIFAPPLQYIAITAGFTPLSILAPLVIGLWTLALQIIAIRESFELSTSQAIFLYLIPMILVIMILIVILVTISSTIPFYK